jgi:phage tail protein X
MADQALIERAARELASIRGDNPDHVDLFDVVAWTKYAPEVERALQVAEAIARANPSSMATSAHA